jgi:peroxiredoxin
VEDHQLKLSSFIGSSPAYYTATVDADGRITGESVNARSSLPFIATPDASAELPDAYALTKLKAGENRLQFRFPDAEGKLISNTDASFQGKPLIIAIGGTWCPNCIDEAGFLSRWYLENKKRGIEVIALQYERQTDAAFVKKAFTRFRQQFNIQYPLLLGGIADKQAVVASLPALENFISFPTTLFIDRNGVVQKIHTGFNGPATGKYYEEFIREFNSEADKLLR